LRRKKLTFQISAATKLK
ncbi:hlyD secretion family protein, partial [Vibrio parahaemolyticus V-223/04]